MVCTSSIVQWDFPCKNLVAHRVLLVVVRIRACGYGMPKPEPPKENLSPGIRMRSTPSPLVPLASQVKEPLTVGVTLSRSGLLPVDLGTFLQDNLGASEPWRHQMAQRYVAISAHQYGEQWIEHCILSYSETWSSELYGEFFLCLPCSAFLLNRLDTLSEEIQRYFWSRIQHIGFLEIGYINRLLTPLLQFERPHLAVTNVLSWALEHAPETILPEQIAEVLEVSVRTPPGSEFDISQFAYLRSCSIPDKPIWATV